MNKKMMYALVAVVVIIIVVAVVAGAYVLMNNGGDGTTPGVTPTPNPTSTTTGVAGASSLKFTETITNSSGAAQGTYIYSAKNIGTSNLMIRIDMSNIPSSGDIVVIVNGALMQAWTGTGGQWADMSSAFTSNWNAWNSTFVGIQNNLANWTGTGDYTYTDTNGDSLKISNIAINPELADSLFTH